jgi:hypothetical protein
MLFRREAYEQIGGHAGLGGEIVDDRLWLRNYRGGSALARRTPFGSDSCRMYANGKAALEGFTKNYFAVFDFAVLPFISFTFTCCCLPGFR